MRDTRFPGHRGLALAVLVYLLFADSGVSFAQPSPDDLGWPADCASLDQREAARKRFLAGNQLLEDGVYPRAVTEYNAAIALCAHPAFYYNLAIAQIALERPLDAHDSLQHAIAHGPGPIGPDKYEHARRYLELLERQQSRIDVSCNQPGARVTLNGELLFVGPGREQRLVRPGRHQLVASKPGALPDTRELALSPGEQQRFNLVVTLMDEGERVRRWPAWKPWVVVAAGTAVAAGGVTFHVLASRSFAAFDRDFADLGCASPPVEGDATNGCSGSDVDPGLQSQLDRARWQKRIATGLYAVGGAALAAGIVLVYWNRPQLVPVTESARTARARLQAGFTSHGLGASLVISF